MQLPRRVPWRSLSELEQVCSWIYTDENDVNSKRLAVNRLSAWRAITYLPHALESTLSLLVVSLQDNSSQIQSPLLALRQSYSTAIIRLVNGLVDPLQLGAYARSIASIAHQLNLPLWLVEVRHAATHEDLPSIELLREAARESINWLFHNYFLPTLNPSSVPASQPTLRPLAPILHQYKSILKITTRDTSLKSQYKDAVLSIMKDLERWISEAKVGANVAAGEIGWDASVDENHVYSGYIDGKEKLALEGVCDALLEKGALVPLSKKKRDFPLHAFHPPGFSVLLWTPLLQYVQTLHPEFLVVLAGRMTSRLLLDHDMMKTAKLQHDESYEMCLARWVLWCIETREGGGSDPDYNLRKEITASLMQALGHVHNAQRDRRSAMALLETLCCKIPQLEDVLSTLKCISGSTTAISWDASDFPVMDQRLTLLLASKSKSRPDRSVRLTSCNMGKSDALPGWKLLSGAEGWRPCPIGVHCATAGAPLVL